MDKILEWCGFLKVTTDVYGTAGCAGEVSYWSIGGMMYSMKEHPDLDMNFFFKYVVPKLDYYGVSNWNKKKRVEVSLFDGEGKCFMGSDKDTNKAWQVALLKLIEASND